MGGIVRFRGNKLDPATLAALVSGTLLEGHPLNKWWKTQSTQFTDSFMREIRTSMQNGESLTQAITRVTGGTIDGVTTPGIMKTSKRKAGALVATAQSRVANEAALQTFQANTDVIKWISQLSTLDNRTSDICIAYSGQTWDVETLQPVNGSSLPFNGGPPRHFNCRSRLRPVTKSFQELGIDQKEIPASTRASMDGQVPADITFDAFLKGKTTSFQNNLLGPKRAQLWRDNKITLTQLVDMRGNPMTIAQLEQKVGIVPKRDPLLRALPKAQPNKVNSFIDDVKITQAEHDEIVAHARRLAAAADEAEDLITQQIRSLADDVNAEFPEGSLRFAKKGVESTQRKIQTYARDRNLSFTEAADQISDSLRYTYILDEDDYIKAVKATMERFAELGYKNGKFDPAWLKRPDYKGLNINMVTPQGVRMELQFHTAQSFNVKQEINHVLYERFRTLSKAKQVGPEGQALQAEMLANAQAIPVPKNINALADLAKTYNNPSPKAQAEILNKAIKTARIEAEEAFGLLNDIDFDSQEEFAAWVKSIRPGLKSKNADREFMKLVELGEGKVKTNVALKEMAKQVELGDIGQAEQALNSLGPELKTKAVKDELAKLAAKRVEIKKTAIKALNELTDNGTNTPAQIENAIEITTKFAKPTMKIMIQDVGFAMVEKAQKVVDNLVAKFPFKALDELKKAGFSKNQTALLDAEFLEQTAILKDGVFDKVVRDFMVQRITVGTQQIDSAVAQIKALNKASKGVDSMSAILDALPGNLRTSKLLQDAIKGPMKAAAKKAKDARAIVMNELEDIIGSDKFSTHIEVIQEGLKDVHKKLGPKQLKNKVTELEVKVSQANKAEVSIAEYAKDPTDYDLQVTGLLDQFDMKQLDGAVKLFIRDGAGSDQAKSNMLNILAGKSAKQTRAIREYVHRRVNPKKLANGMDFDAKVAEIVTKNVNNASASDIRKHIDAFTTGSDASTKLHFEQTILTRAGVKNIDELGVFSEGDATGTVLKIRAQLAKNDPGNAPIPAHSVDEQFQAAKQWLNAARQSDEAFKTETLNRSKSLVKSGKAVIKKGDGLFGDESWGISPAEWQKWVDDVAPTLDEWDVALINQYTGGMAGRINAGLYDGGMIEEFTAGARAMNKALDKMPKHTGTVYRGTSPRQNWTPDFIDARYEIGKVVTERGFGSASTQVSSQFSGNLKFIIKTKGESGAIIGHLGQYGTSEMEVLFKAGTKFRVIKKSRSADGMKVWMEEV